MPTVTCGLLLSIDLGIGIGAASFLAFTYSHWWWLATIPFMILAVYALHYVPWFVEWLLAHFFACPGCGARRWGFPHTEGFGL